MTAGLFAFHDTSTAPPATVPTGLPVASVAADLGLSKSHIRPAPRGPSVQFFPDSSFLKVYRGTQKPREESESAPPPKRGRCLHFTGACQRRMRNSMAQTMRAAPAAFATLTYPAVWEPDARVWKRHLATFLKRLFRKYPWIAGFWKLEFQKRGAPHFHLMLFGAPRVEDDARAFGDLREWIAENWYEVVGSTQEAHRYAGTQLDEVRKGAMQYTCKYVSKDQLPESVRDTHNGRWWGAFNRAKLPKKKPLEVSLEPHEAQMFLRTVRRFVSRLRQDNQGRFRRRRSRASTGIVLICDANTWAKQIIPLCELAAANHVPAENRPF